jgi:small subunit ribosomal protein S7
MSRRKVKTKYFTLPDVAYHSYLVHILISRITFNGKKTLAQNIIFKTFCIIKERLNIEKPYKILEAAIRNVTPAIKIRTRKFKKTVKRIPIEINNFKGSNIAVRWILLCANKRSGKTIALKLANELIDASNKSGEAHKKKLETHRTAEANKTFAHSTY